MSQKEPRGFSRREKQMMDVVYRLGEVTAAEVRTQLSDPPSYSSVRSTLAGLEKKGHLRHRYDGNRYIYLPTVKREKAQESALDHLLTTFFDGSAAEVVAALIKSKKSDLSTDELEELSKLIAKTRKEGR